MLRRGDQLLFLCAAALAACNFESVPIGPQGDDAAMSQDDKLAMYGELLKGTWRGLTTVQTLLYTGDLGLILQWMPDTDAPRSGRLSIRCMDGGNDCTPGAGTGDLLFSYSLYAVTEQDEVKGALEFENMGQVEGLASLVLTFHSAYELSLVSSGGGPIPFVKLSGRLGKDPGPVVVPGPPSLGTSP